MKLAHVITTLNAGGAEKLILDSVPQYLHLGYQVDVIVLKGSNSFLLNDLRATVKVIELGKGSVYNPLNIVKLKRLLGNYDIVHLHLFPVLYWGVFAKFFWRLRIPLIYTEHSTNNKRRNNLIFRIIDRWVYKKLDFIGCISEGTKSNLVKHLGKTHVPIKVISNGINLDAFRCLNKEHKRFFSEDDFILVQVSSFRSQKDQKTLIRSLNKLPDKIKLILVGEGTLRQECEMLVSDLGLSHRVLFLGVRNDIPLILSDANVVVLSSNIEGFGLAIVEGMAAGKPVIASDIEGLRDVVKGYGLLFKNGDDDELAHNIKILYEDSDLYQEISKKCLLRSRDFDIRKMAEEYSKIYVDVGHLRKLNPSSIH